MKKVIFIIAMFPFFFTMGGTELHHDRMTFGAEWGYIAVFYSGYHYNFFAPEGYRVDPRGHEFRYDSNAEGYLHVGYDLSDRYNLSLHMGLSAIEDYHLTVPMSLRLTRYYGEDPARDRWFTFIDLGSGVSIKENPQEILTGKLGAGYRMALSRKTKLDFHISLRTIYTHPEIYYYGVSIRHDKINRSNAYVSAVSLGMSITF